PGTRPWRMPPFDRDADIAQPAGAACRRGGLPRKTERAVRVELSLCDRSREDLQHNTEGLVSVEGRSPSGGDLDGLDSQPRNRSPVEPTTVRIIRRKAIEQDQGARDAGRAHPAQVDPLRGGVRDEAARPPEGGERGDYPEQLVQRLARALGDLAVREDGDGSGHGADRPGCSRGR